MSDPTRRYRGYIWDDEQGRYVIPDEHVQTDAQGVKRDYGVIYDERGNGYRCGWPGERIARPRANGGAIIADGVEPSSFNLDGASLFKDS